MSSNFFVIFNDTTDKEIGLNAIKRPDIPTPIQNIKEIPLDGRDGILTVNDGTYKNIEISVEYNFIDRIDFNNKSRAIKKWVSNIKDDKLQFSDDLDIFYIVKYCKIDDIQRIKKIKGKMKIVFVCEPYSYYKDGLEEIINPNIIYNNSFITAKPIIKIIAEGYVTLTINNKSVRFNVGQELLIDTKLEICFKEGIANNISLEEGWYDDLHLYEGENIITWSGGSSIEIILIPNWKTV